MHPFLVTVLAVAVTAKAQAPMTPAPEAKVAVPRAMRASAPAATEPLGAAWQRFLGSQPDATWWSRWCPATGTPMEIYGSGLPLGDWRGDSLAEARRGAARLLQEQRELLGLGDCEFREIIGARMGQTWAFVYDQYYRGLPVVDGRADVRVHAVGRIPMFGSTAWQIPADFVTTPTLGELAATGIAWRQVGTDLAPGQAEAAGTPRLVIWGDVLAPSRTAVQLAWEVPIRNVDQDGRGPIGRYYVDAQNGSILQYRSDKHECETHLPGGGERHDEPVGPAALPLVATGTLVAATRTGLGAGSALVTVPVPGVAIVTGQGTVFTDANGNFSVGLPLFTTSTSANFTLDGVHNQAIVGNNAPSLNRTLFAGNNGTITLPVTTALQAAHTTAYHWIYQANEFCRSILGNTPELGVADNVQPFVNIASTCNSYYSNNTIGFYQAGSGCANTAFATIVMHEWGHGLDDRYGGISNNPGDGLSEGWGDLVAMYQADTPLIGDGYYTAGGFLRTGNNSRTYPPPVDVHEAGEVWMGFGWQLRERLAATLGSRQTAINLTNYNLLGTIVADATDQLGAYLQVYVADDDNGNLADLTPHATEIAWAGAAKHYPYPLAAPPSYDECAGAAIVDIGTWGPFDNRLALNSAPDWNCANAGKDVWMKCLAGVGPLSVSTCGGTTLDTVIEVFSGSCGNLTLLGCDDDSCTFQSSVTLTVTSPGWHYIRVGGFGNDSGTFNVSIQGTPCTLASWSPYGAGCNVVSKAWYEYFAPGTFDLGLSAMRMTRNGATYTVAPGGSYHVPGPGSTILPLFDDSETTVSLAGTFAYPGGSTSSLVVCSNGFVSVGAGNGTTNSLDANVWLNGPQTRWGTWHDFDPTRSGSGVVKFEKVGQVVYLTWDGVMDYRSTNQNTWQMQFDLATGNVTFVWLALSSVDDFLIGYAPGGGNPDQGSRDLSATMPFATNTANTYPLTLASSNPTLGTVAQLTATRFPGNTTLGALLEGFVQQSPGLSLASFGMPSCFAYVGSPNVTILLLPSNGSASYGQPLPNDGNLMGLPLVAQAFAFAPGTNAAGVIASNGVRLLVGF